MFNGVGCLLVSTPNGHHARSGDSVRTGGGSETPLRNALRWAPWCLESRLGRTETL